MHNDEPNEYAQTFAAAVIAFLAGWGLCDLLGLFIDVSFHLPT
jgi:hypothetical protein